MSRNKVQFQKSISIHSFIEKYGSEEQCKNHLFALRWPNGFHCPYCGHDHYCQLKSRALYQCNQCHHQTSLVAGTVVNQLTTWLLLLCELMPQRRMALKTAYAAAGSSPRRVTYLH